ncbi:MAG: DUF389 domain-containing protein [Pyrinomonadaceae bacterium]
MNQTESTKITEPTQASHFRDWFAKSLGVRPERKEEIYLEINNSATLRDISYWLQIFFSAGIATLGLVLNSPAVIIGAMLISPLMGPILAAGLALAAGDIVLGVRAITSLALSCFIAISLAVALVALLPFKEITAEIAARTQPNTLDLFVALFSGAIGSVAICKEVKGVVTSIPGVAIAVALMPPLCVTGFGLGIALSANAAEGMRVARGGGLLFLTNFVAITFTAMIVFLLLHIDTLKVRERVREWRRENNEGGWVQTLITRLPASEQLRKIGGLPGRILLIVIIISLIMIPLSQSFSQLKQEIAQKKQENSIRQAATEVWEQNFSKLPNGEPRGYIGQLSTSDQDGKLTLQLRVFTNKAYTASEKASFIRTLAARLSRPEKSLALQLIEIPTASSELLTRRQEEARVAETPVEAAPTVAQLQASFQQQIEASLSGLQLPPPAQLIDYSVTTAPAQPLQVTFIYLSDRDIEGDAQSLIAADIKSRLEEPTATVSMQRIEISSGPLAFNRNQATVTEINAGVLNNVGQLLQQHQTLRVQITANADTAEQEGMAGKRAEAITEYLASKWQIASERTTVVPGTEAGRLATLTIKAGAPQ